MGFPQRRMTNVRNYEPASGARSYGLASQPVGRRFLGGAICAHVRIGELGAPPEIISLLLGAMTWGGLYARNPRIRAILPLIR